MHKFNLAFQLSRSVVTVGLITVIYSLFTGRQSAHLALSYSWISHTLNGSYSWTLYSISHYTYTTETYYTTLPAHRHRRRPVPDYLHDTSPV